MKKFLLICIAVAAVSVCKAQLKLGVKAGLSFANQRMEQEGRKLTTDGRSFFHAGVMADMPVYDAISLQPQLILGKKGTLYTPNNDPSKETKINITYIDVPVMAVYKYPVKQGKVFAGLGPVFSFIAGGKLSQNSKTKKLDFDDWKRSDVGLGLTAGFECNNGFFGSIGYTAGMSDIYKPEILKTKNRVFMVSAGYLLGSRK
ncbi:MAG TPA: porin family protein [Chitinophagaceae bacterium]|nr:porin family protein [Chitinophagaceae bacterium]